MSARSMNVFSLRDTVVEEYKQFATSFTTIHAEDIREQVDAIYAQNRYWPDPLIQINPRYRDGKTIDQMVEDKTLDPRTSEIFRLGVTAGAPRGRPMTLYRHQEQAVVLAAQGESLVVTTGTGSGKSLCFFIPIVNTVLVEKREDKRPRTRAIVIYPMNALANSQLEELEKFVSNVSGPRPVTFARYTGQESTEERDRIADNPPDILLTNFMMLELLMTRQDERDRKVMDNCAGLRFLVLDELHTYRGRQGADVALLVRRVRERLSPDRLVCIGTSATMASEGSGEEKGRVVARVASKLFSVPIPESNIIGETLDRITEESLHADNVRADLGPAIDAGVTPDISNDDLRRHPLAVWVETRLGVRFSNVDQRWVRARPKSLDEAARALAADAGREVEACAAALRDLLLVSSEPESERTGNPEASPDSFFAFKLHQFISGARHAFSTLEPPGRRTILVEGQKYLPGDPEKLLYPVHFCRDCGHEYHPVRRVMDNGVPKILARDIEDAPPIPPDMEDDAAGDEEEAGDREVFGFISLHAEDEGFSFNDRDDDYPETWLEYDTAGNPKRLKSYYRGARATSVRMLPDGTLGSGVRAWFIPGKFRFCLRCGTTHSTAARDRNRLASLSAEGRSSATTVLTGSVLRWMHGGQCNLEQYSRKLLGFSDNRQDAALQAGHFNDFLFVSLVRAAFLGALQQAGEAGLRSDHLGKAQQEALGFHRAVPEIKAEWLQEPDLRGFNLQDAENTLREVLTYRVWFDQRRGWRYTCPNLEQLGLVEVDYLGVEDLAADQELFEDAPALLRDASPAVRSAVYREILDHLRKWMAVRSQVLDAAVIQQVLARAHSRLNAPWGFESDEQPRPAGWLMLSPPTRRDTSLRDEDLIVRGSSRSALGKVLRSSRSPSGRTLWDDAVAVRALKAPEWNELMKALLKAACAHGLISEEATPFGDEPGYRLNDACVLFKLGQGESPPSSRGDNAFFRDFYANLAHLLRDPVHPLFSFEAREHTAQVEPQKRKVREQRFRFGPREQEELANDDSRLRELGESRRFLPVMFCSPTMELGVDISALNSVYLRNMPPTPANYAQRSGRAGRSGQAALVLTYCSALGPHDQYFFRDPKEMVHGEVRPPLLDLANRDLVESHMQAVWLACTQEPLEGSIAELLLLNDPARPIKPELLRAMGEPRVAEEATRRIIRVLAMLEDDLTPAFAPWFEGDETFAAQVVVAARDCFDQAFDRWRDLFLAAEQQRDAARRTMDNYSAPQVEKRAARRKHRQANDALDLLQAGTSALYSDFYTYRYLATEGFLPGYNFPRLPLRAYVPGGPGGRGRQTYLHRPRFLALSEFGPRSLVYHEGRAFRVVRAFLSLGQRGEGEAEAYLPTKSVRICLHCGAGHFNDTDSICHACAMPLDTAEIVRDIYRIENVGTWPAERITANDEERKRQGFELQTTFEWAVRDQVLDVRESAARDADGEILRLSYGPGTTITRLNKGLRRRANPTQFGFMIDPHSGYWAKNDAEEGDEPQDPTVNPRQRIVPGVQDRKNALLLQLAQPGLERRTVATLQHALLRGIEAVFQLEQGEVLAEPMPSSAERNGFLLYEAAEGGAGVLTRLVAEGKRLAEVARKALAIMHFDVEGDGTLPADAESLQDQPGTACVAACYHCIMSYYNQPDHDLLDRRDKDARLLLLRLARASTTGITEALAVDAGSDSPPPSQADGPVTRWLAQAEARELPRPDAEPLAMGDTLIQLVWRSHYVAALLGAPPEEAVAQLEARGFEVVVFPDKEEAWPEPFTRLASALGREI